MDVSGFPLQSYFIYRKGWNEEMDESFINTLIEQKEKGNWVASMKGNYHALLMAQGRVNEIAWWPRNWDDVVERQTQLKKRYHTFKRIIESDGVSWDSSLNVVRAKPEVWESLIKKDQFAAAYFHRGEPQFINLNHLFGRNAAVPVYFGHEIVNLSDSPADKFVVLSDDSTEAISPLVPRSKTHVYKKLFDEEPLPMPVRGEASGQHFPLANAFPPKPVDRKGGSTNVPSGESSCASCSPVKWFSFHDGH